MKRKSDQRIEVPVKEMQEALKHIAEMGLNMKEDVIDWKNIGKNAVHTARVTLAGKCTECGRQKDFIYEKRK